MSNNEEEIEKILETLLSLMKKEDLKNNNENVKNNFNMYLKIIGEFATLPNKVIYPILEQKLEDLFESEDPRDRCIGFKVLGKISRNEGCMEPAGDNIDSFTEIISRGIFDVSFLVR